MLFPRLLLAALLPGLLPRNGAVCGPRCGTCHLGATLLLLLLLLLLLVLILLLSRQADHLL